MRTIHKVTAPLHIERAAEIPLARYTVPGWPWYGAPIIRHVDILTPGTLTAWMERNVPTAPAEIDSVGPSTVTWTLEVALYATGAVIPLGEYLQTLTHTDPTTGLITYWHAHTFGSPHQTLNGHTDKE